VTFGSRKVTNTIKSRAQVDRSRGKAQKAVLHRVVWWTETPTMKTGKDQSMQRTVSYGMRVVGKYTYFKEMCSGSKAGSYLRL